MREPGAVGHSELRRSRNRNTRVYKRCLVNDPNFQHFLDNKPYRSPLSRNEDFGSPSVGSLLSVEDLMEHLHAGRTTIYELLGSGRIRSFKVGRRRLVRPQDLQEFIDGLLDVSEASK
jgi:excisionase family DNA binding protein